jgi:hypothetical protein
MYNYKINANNRNERFGMLNIEQYTQDGFVKVCEVSACGYGHWYYKNINRDVMFDPHKSWIYFIVVDSEIFKIGESGNPLGIESKRVYPNEEPQPKKGTMSRFGRYRNGDGTDVFIRDALRKEVKAGRVSLWAKRCDMVEMELTIAGKKQITLTSFHKDLELRYLKHFVEHVGCLPKLNKSHK